MNPARLAALAVAALLAVAGAFWLSSQRQLEPASERGTRVLDGLQERIDEASEVRLLRGDGATVTLRRTDGGWRVVERDYAADPGRLRKLLLDLAALEIVEEKTREPASYPRLGVEDVAGPKATGTRVELSAGDARYALIVGRTQGARETYVRVADQPQSFLATPQLSVEVNPARWLDTRLVDVQPERVASLEVRLPGAAPWTASRGDAAQAAFDVAPLPRGRSAAAAEVRSGLGGGLAGLEFTDVRRATTLDGPAPVLVVRSFDGLTLTLTGRDDGSRRWVRVTAAGEGAAADEARTLAARLEGWEYEIPGWKYATLFRPLEELLAAPATTG